MGFSEDFRGLRWMIPRGYHVKRGVILKPGGIFLNIVSFFVNFVAHQRSQKRVWPLFLFIETNQRIIGLLVNKKSKPRTCKIWWHVHMKKKSEFLAWYFVETRGICTAITTGGRWSFRIFAVYVATHRWCRTGWQTSTLICGGRAEFDFWHLDLTEAWESV